VTNAKNHICSRRKEKEQNADSQKGRLDEDRYYKIQATSSRWHSSSQQADVVHKALDKVLILVLWIACHGKLTLATDFSGRDFNLELMLELILARLLLLVVRRLFSGFRGNIGTFGAHTSDLAT
jgi:hypothetical protein